MDLLWTVYALPDGPASIARMPGVPEPGTGHTALFAAARHIHATRAFVAGPGLTATALWVARAGAAVTCWTENAAEGESLRASFTHNRLPAPHSFVQADFVGLEPATCEAALIHLPRGKDMQAEMLRLAAAMLRPGGRLAFVGATDEGVKSALEEARAIFGQVGIVVRKGGCHAGLAQRPDGDFPLPEIYRSERDIVVNGAATRLVSYAGAFAAERLDDGAAALIAGMRITPGARVLDLGCGTGVVGLAALRQGARVTLTDVSARAVVSARETLAANGYPDAAVAHACGAVTIETATCDVVVANPPFHQGRDIHFEVARMFIQEAARVLKAGGALYLVANVFLDYEAWLRGCFNKVQSVWENRRFRVWEARK
ncbi:MAG TPA: methyltransferase [Anaerolineae bacterium]|nr:methyltransferase [Anaerolineae bacterium]HQI84036.1 methyltransferase [Anaerolineae bacterium]